MKTGNVAQPVARNLRLPLQACAVGSLCPCFLLSTPSAGWFLCSDPTDLCGQWTRQSGVCALGLRPDPWPKPARQGRRLRSTGWWRLPQKAPMSCRSTGTSKWAPPPRCRLPARCTVLRCHPVSVATPADGPSWTVLAGRALAASKKREFSQRVTSRGPVGQKVYTSKVLGSYKDSIVYLKLPKRITEYKSFGIFCKKFKADFGNVKLPVGFQLPKEQSMGKLNTKQASTMATDVILKDSATVLLKDFEYDGSCTDSAFFVAAPTSQAKPEELTRLTYGNGKCRFAAGSTVGVVTVHLERGRNGGGYRRSPVLRWLRSRQELVTTAANYVQI
ncbi:uncharacterized protein [Dermacentor andersoni]|uniref:uncharacterized protein isoform X2 n=1 Tax=Dermacentor andersoni TaxID=34620 RepID=UPI0024175114|nr:uncharacterized protein LOC126534797 isoform X2 [Dermacentor andersoni]